MDPLSDVLALVKTAHYISGALEAGGEWYVHFPATRTLLTFTSVRR